MSVDRRAPARVLMTADAVGGVWQYSVDLVSELTKHGTEVLVTVLGPPPSTEQAGQIRRLPGVELAAADFALEWMAEPWADVGRSREWLLSLAERFNPSLIHLNSYALADSAWAAPTVVVAHSCVYSWWLAVHGGAPPPPWECYRQQVSQGLAAAGAIVAPSRFMEDALVSHYGVAREKVRVIPNFSLAPVAESTGKQPYALAAGRLWDRAKNLSLLESISSDMDWPLYVAGSEEADSEKNAGPFRRLGRLSHRDLLDRMARASIFVHPALYEPFGLAVLEAARAKCCLVLADIPSLRELWNGAAVFLDSHDRAGWTAALNGLIADAAGRERLAERACAHAAGYPAQRSVAQYIETYDAAMQRARAGSGAAA